jgi:small subunit ribosomal protein S11
LAKKAEKKTQKTTKTAKKSKKVAGGKGIAYVNSTFNNTIITITDLSGEVVSSSSPGVVGFKGSKKSTAYAATKAAENAAEKARLRGATEVEIFVKGLGVGRNAAVKGLRSGGLKITKLVDRTPIPHGGPTPRKLPRGS